MIATDFANPDAVRRLQARAADEDLSNRRIAPEERIRSHRIETTCTVCALPLTIDDAWNTCTECLERFR